MRDPIGWYIERDIERQAARGGKYVDTNWDLIWPLLDEGIDLLPEIQRQVLVLLFFKRTPVEAIQALLGIRASELRLHTMKALSALQIFFSRGGIEVGVDVLTANLALNAIGVAPAGLAERLAAAILCEGKHFSRTNRPGNAREDG